MIRYYVECKRPNGSHSVRPSVRKAISQLKAQLPPSAESGTSYGFIALSIDKVINPKHDLLVSETDRSLDDRMTLEISDFINQFRIFWANPIHPRILGVLIFLQTAATIEVRHLLATAMFLGVNNIVEKSSLGYTVLESVVSRLAKVITKNVGALTTHSS